MPVALSVDSHGSGIGPSASEQARLSSSWLWDVLIGVGLLGLVVGIHLGVPGSVPSGADGGNWLALSRVLLGDSVMSADTFYPPLYIGLLAGLQIILPSVAALAVSALLAKGILLLAVYVAARPAGRGVSLLAALLVGFAGAQLEAYAWGAYPQLLSTAFGLLATERLIRAIGESRWRNVALAALYGTLASATHIMIGGLLPLILLLAGAHWLWMTRADWSDWKRGVVKTIAAAVPGVVTFGAVWWRTSTFGVDPSLNPLGIDYLEAFTRLFREAAVPWLVICGVGLAAMVWRRWSLPMQQVVSTAGGWSVAGLVFFLVSGEPRALLLTQMGLAIAGGVVAGAILEWLRHRPVRGVHRQPGSRLGRTVVIAVIFSMAAAISVAGVVAYIDATKWYRVVGHSELEALNTLAAISSTNDVVLASEGHHGNPLGWWIEGYAERPTYTAVDIAALTFKEEQVQAMMADEFFSIDPSNAEAQTILSEIGASFIAVDRRGPDASWLEGVSSSSYVEVYESEVLVILQTLSDPP